MRRAASGDLVLIDDDYPKSPRELGPGELVTLLLADAKRPVASDSIRCVQRSDRSTTTSLNWITGVMSV